MPVCLLVDDSGVIRHVERRMMESLNFEVREAADGLIALEQCATSLPDVILLDWNMPNMDGITFLGELRKMPGADAVKVIFCTTETDMSFISQAISVGADEYVMKPFDQATLENKLGEVGLL